MNDEAKNIGPMSGFRALDLTDENGYLCGKFLGDLGADVVKVEKPGGDEGRRRSPFYKDTPHPEKSLYWMALNCNKRGVTLNLKSNEGRQILRTLAKSAHFLIESFPPGEMAGMELGYETLSKINPALIMTSITPFGQTGPYRDFKGSDLVVTAMSTFMSLTGYPDQPPMRVSFPQSPAWAAVYALVGTLVAHYHRQTTGQGQYVDVSAQASTCWAGAQAPFFWEAERTKPQRAGHVVTGRSTKGGVFPAFYRCKDGYVSFMIYGDKAGAISNRVLTEWLDSKGLASDFMKQTDWEKFHPSYAAQEEFDQIINPVTRFAETMGKNEFYKKALGSRLMCSPVFDAADVIRDHQLEARGFWEEVDHPKLGTKITYPGFFAKMSETPLRIRRSAPLIGEHNIEIYCEELGFSRKDLTRLMEAGVI